MKIDTLNLDNNSKFNQGFAPSTITGVDWEIDLNNIKISSEKVDIPIIFTANNFSQIRVLSHAHTGDTSLGIDSMNDFVGYLYGVVLSQDELKDSVPE